MADKVDKVVEVFDDGVDVNVVIFYCLKQRQAMSPFGIETFVANSSSRK